MDVERQVCELLRPFGITKRYIGVSQLTLALLILLKDPTSLHAVQNTDIHGHCGEVLRELEKH